MFSSLAYVAYLCGQLGPESKTTAAEEKPTSSLKQLPDVACKVASEQSKFSVNDSEAANDLNAAKVAAMKAAELGMCSLWLLSYICYYAC